MDEVSQNPLAVPAVRRLVVARLLTTLAIQAVSITLGWQVFAWTRDPLMLGLLGLAQFVPMMVLAPIAGHLVDRSSRRNMAALAIAGCALFTLMLPIAVAFETARVPILIATSGLLGALRAFAGPALSALLPELVPQALLPRALAMVSSVFQLAMVFGPALGGFALGEVGATRVYQSAFAVLCVASLLFWSLPNRPAAKRDRDPARDLWAGLRFVRQKPALLGAMSLDLFAVLLGGAVALLPAVAQELLHVDAATFGWLRSAPALGALATGLVLTRFPIQRRIGSVMLLSVGVYGLTMIGFGLSRTVGWSMFFLGLSGASDMVSVVLRHSLIQLETPDAMRGRVSAVSQLFISASNELGELESGVTARLFGVSRAIVIGGVGTVIVVCSWFRVFPALANKDRLTPEDAT